MATTYVILGSEGFDEDAKLLASGYTTRQAAQRRMHDFDGPPTRTVMTMRSWLALEASQREVNEQREAESNRDAAARKTTSGRFAALVCPVTESLADHIMLVGSSGHERRVPVGDCGLRALLGGRKSLRVDFAGRLDYDSHLMDAGRIEWYENGVKHVVLMDATLQEAVRPYVQGAR